MGTTSTSEEKISVSVRVRPLNDAEKELGCAWRHVDDAIVLDATSVRFSYSPSFSLSLSKLRYAEFVGTLSLSLCFLNNRPISEVISDSVSLFNLVVFIHRKPQLLTKNHPCTASITSSTNPAPIWTSTTRRLRK